MFYFQLRHSVSVHRMLMPKKNRVAIYEYLFKEGVMVAKKDFHAPKHCDLEFIPNLQVIKAMQVRFIMV
jgi:small subunit ribosomal protein S10e